VKLHLTPITISDAKTFVADHHRHHPAPTGAIFAVAVSNESGVVGVAIVGRPVARMCDNGWTAEVIRVAVLPGVPNACSMLYGAAWRACRALGYARLITYILATEPGTSLAAAGFRKVAEVKAETWHRESRPRVDKTPLQGKFRFEKVA
jgi:hypothetical protein